MDCPGEERSIEDSLKWRDTVDNILKRFSVSSEIA